jgi:hypothetical protein
VGEGRRRVRRRVRRRRGREDSDLDIFILGGGLGGG